MKQRVLFFIAVCFFLPSLWVYYSNDDFFHFSIIANVGGVRDLLSFLWFRSAESTGVAFYRPIPRELLSYILLNLFGLHAFPARVLGLVLHGVNTILVYSLFSHFLSNKRQAWIAAVLFGISAANTGALYYFAGGIQTQIALLFLLLSGIQAYRCNASNHMRDLVTSYLFFVGSIASHELGFITAFVVWMILKKKTRVLPYGVTLFLYALVNIFVIGFPAGQSDVYGITLSVSKLINGYAWYGMWAWGIPEMFLDYVGNNLSVSAKLFEYWGIYATPIFALFGVSVSIAILGTWRTYSSIHWSKVVLLLGWFAIGIGPMVVLPEHRSYYYLQTVLPAFCGLIAIIVTKHTKIFVAVFVAFSLVSSVLTFKTYPAVLRGNVAQSFLSDLKSQYPSLPKGATLVVLNDPSYPFISESWGGSAKQVSYALSGDDAVKLLYRDSTLHVVFEGIDEIQDSDYVITAQIR